MRKLLALFLFVSTAFVACAGPKPVGGTTTGITNGQTGVTLSGTFSGTHTGDGSGLSGVVSAPFATNSFIGVSGAGTVAVNGLYLMASSICYTNVNGITYMTNIGTSWDIKSAGRLYYRLSAPSSPPISSSGWSVISLGISPAPTSAYGYSMAGDGVSGSGAGLSGMLKAVSFSIDGNGSTIGTGVKKYIFMPFNGTLVSASVLADRSGSISLEVWKCTQSQFDAGSTHPVSADKITASAPLSISSGTSFYRNEGDYQSLWTTASFSNGDVLAFNVASVTTIQRVDVMLTFVTR